MKLININKLACLVAGITIAWLIFLTSVENREELSNIEIPDDHFAVSRTTATFFTGSGPDLGVRLDRGFDSYSIQVLPNSLKERFDKLFALGGKEAEALGLQFRSNDTQLVGKHNKSTTTRVHSYAIVD